MHGSEGYAPVSCLNRASLCLASVMVCSGHHGHQVSSDANMFSSYLLSIVTSFILILAYFVYLIHLYAET